MWMRVVSELINCIDQSYVSMQSIRMSINYPIPHSITTHQPKYTTFVCYFTLPSVVLLPFPPYKYYFFNTSNKSISILMKQILLLLTLIGLITCAINLKL